MHKPTAIALASLFVALAASPASSEPVNRLREHVRQWEHRAMERFLGKEAADRMAATPKIIGGQKAPPGKWPFQVALLQSNINNNFDAQFCGGTLISATIVITAAHCISEKNGSVTPAADIEVLTGTQSLISGGTRRQIAKIKRHPSYNDNTTDYDIAVIKLKTAASGLKYATMIAKSQEKTFAPTGTMSYVTGWGDMSDGNGHYAKDLMQVQVPIVSTTTCNGPNSYDGDVTGRMICAGLSGGGKDSCSGDSGGPLTVMDSNGKFQLLAGIVSWGNGCAEADFFGVYSRVAVLSAWANNAIASLGADTRDNEVVASCEGKRGSALAACLDSASLLPD